LNGVEERAGFIGLTGKGVTTEVTTRPPLETGCSCDLLTMTTLRAYSRGTAQVVELSKERRRLSEEKTQRGEEKRDQTLGAICLWKIHKNQKSGRPFETTQGEVVDGNNKEEGYERELQGVT